MTVAVLLPIEIITGYLAALTAAIVRNVNTSDGDKWDGPIKKIVSPLIDKIIIANSKLIAKIAENRTYSCAEGGGFYPVSDLSGVTSSFEDWLLMQDTNSSAFLFQLFAEYHRLNVRTPATPAMKLAKLASSAATRKRMPALLSSNPRQPPRTIRCPALRCSSLG